MAYDNQTDPTGVIVTLAASDWSTDPLDSTRKIASFASLSLDESVPLDEQLVVVRQFDFSTIASTPSPLLTGSEAWDVWTLPNASSSGSNMYTVDTAARTISMSAADADFVFTRSSGTTVQLPVFDSSADTVYILRKTQDLTNYVNWAAGSRITAKQLNHGLLQLLNISQEIAAMQDNKDTLDPFVGKPSGICPLDSTGKIANTYIGAATLNNTAGDGISGTGTSDDPLAVDLATSSGLAISSEKLKVDTVDNLTSTGETAKPLSANQGYVLDQKIDGLGSTFTYKGTINTDSMPSEPSAVAGDTYDIIGSATVDLDASGGVGWNAGSAGPSITGGDIIRYDGTNWVEVTQAQVIRADGTVALHTNQVAVTQSAGDDSTKVATTAHVLDRIQASSIEELNDVASFSPASNDILKWNGSAWTNDATVMRKTDSVGDLADVDDSAKGTGKILQYNSSGDLVAVTNSASIPTAVTVSASADYTGAADASAYVNTALIDSTLGHAGTPATTTVADLDLKNGKFMIGTAANAAPGTVLDLAKVRNNVRIKDGEFIFNEVNTATKTMLNTTALTDYSLNLSAAAKRGQKSISIDDVAHLHEGTLIRIGTETSSTAIWQSADTTYKTYPGEMNIVSRVEGSTVYLKYKLTADYDNGEGVKVSTLTTYDTAATCTITITNYANIASGDAISLFKTNETTPVKFAGSGGDVAFSSVTSNNQTATNLAAAIDGVSGFSASADGAVVTVTQGVLGPKGNTNVYPEDSGSAGFTVTDFSGGLDPQLSDMTFTNVTFKDKNGASYTCDTNAVGRSSSTYTLTLPKYHELADTISTTARIHLLDITGSLGGTKRWTNTNGDLVVTCAAADKEDDEDRNYKLRLTLNNSQTTDAAAFGGSQTFVSIGVNTGIKLKYAKKIVFRDCVFENFKIGCQLLYCDDILFDNCTFKGVRRVGDLYDPLSSSADGDSGISMEGCRNVTIKNCSFINCWQAISIDSNESDPRPNHDIIIRNNNIDDCANGIICTDYNSILIDSIIKDNKINISAANPLQNPWNTSYAGYRQTGIGICAWDVIVDGNDVGGRSYPVTEATYSPTGYGVDAAGESQYPIGGVTFADSDYATKELPTCYHGIIIQVLGGARRNNYNGPRTNTHSGNEKNIGTWNENSTLQVTNNQIQAWNNGLMVRFRGGTLADPVDANHVRIDDNNIYAMRFGMLLYSGYGTQHAQQHMTVHRNSIYIDPYWKMFSAVPWVWTDSQSSNQRTTAWGSDSLSTMYLNQLATDSGTHYENEYWYLSIKNNMMMNYSNDERTYNLKTAGTFDNTWLMYAIIQNNTIYGGRYSIHFASSTHSTNRSTYRSDISYNGMYDYGKSYANSNVFRTDAGNNYGWNRAAFEGGPQD